MGVIKVNKTVELVKLWGAYEEKYPDRSIEDFFRYQLAEDVKAEKDNAPKGELHPDLNGRFIILLRRIGRFHIIYSNKALEGTGLGQIEEFGILVTIYNQKNPIKSEAIYNNIMELSSGTNMLIRMKRKGLVNEYPDPEDKRVKRLKLTAKGEAVLLGTKDKVMQVAHMILHGMTDNDKQLCMQLLGPINKRFSGLFQKQKNKTFDEVYQENMV